jgi:hypothetical protein
MTFWKEFLLKPLPYFIIGIALGLRPEQSRLEGFGKGFGETLIHKRISLSE